MKPLGSLRGPCPLGRCAAFTVLTVTTVVLMATASAPSPFWTVTAVGTSVGLAAGAAAVVGLLVQSVPRPDTDVFSVLTRVFLLLAVAI
jgi:hypothetical protein